MWGLVCSASCKVLALKKQPSAPKSGIPPRPQVALLEVAGEEWRGQGSQSDGRSAALQCAPGSPPMQRGPGTSLVAPQWGMTWL
ncbi:hypothetical protein NDU88_007501 [Pleurodeles waltl]|uniref:Uncharacterized protein n=1 Tax=Pleurodeles waltl TaxID=8319 RepID=A0AAV7N2A2_PLEWA|nr:hypothetical protein NDU88_007501 [Pleurodeles waltl]